MTDMQTPWGTCGGGYPGYPDGGESQRVQRLWVHDDIGQFSAKQNEFRML